MPKDYTVRNFDYQFPEKVAELDLPEQTTDFVGKIKKDLENAKKERLKKYLLEDEKAK